jgi:hypothetical protein
MASRLGRCAVVMMMLMAEIAYQEHERIEIELPTRLWLDETKNGRAVRFEGHAKTRDLSIGGTFLYSEYLLPVGCPINLEMSLDDGDVLSARGEVVHRIRAGEGDEPGMGVVFTALDAENRERLLRFFVSDRVREFYEQRFIIEFPHLGGVMSLQDVALVINLWEDKDGRLTSLRARASDQQEREHRQQEVRATKRRTHAGLNG